MEDKNNKKSFLTPFLIIVILVISFVAGSLFQKVKTLEKDTTASTTAGTVAGETTNRLSLDNLKQYAQELNLDTQRFNSCLDNSEKKELVSADVQEGEKEGVTGTPAFFINGYLVSGALPFEMFKTLIDYELESGFGKTKTYPDEVQKLIDQGIITLEKKEIETEGAPTKGPQNAKITLVEYTDFECPYCLRAAPTVEEILKNYPNEVRLVFKQFPLTMIHSSAQKAAEASLCAFDQGKFWEYHDKLFEIND